MIRICLVLILSVAVLGSVVAQEKGKDKSTDKVKDDSFVKIEARGVVLTGIKIKGVESTGVMIRTQVGAFELDLDKKQKELATKLDGKTVLITGEIVMRTSGKISTTVIKVASLAEAK